MTKHATSIQLEKPGPNNDLNVAHLTAVSLANSPAQHTAKGGWQPSATAAQLGQWWRAIQ